MGWLLLKGPSVPVLDWKMAKAPVGVSGANILEILIA
jgi:hypothetical protein